MKLNEKIIFHIDLNQFFCSVAMIKNPRLRGKAFAIGRENTTKGVVSTASYEARKYGVHAGMPMVEAYQKLPTLIVVDYGYDLYTEYSRKFFRLLKEYVRNIEQTSIDEGYLDVTDITIKVNRHPLDLAKEIQSRSLKELNLPCSIGIAPTLFLAKMASDMKKPLGVTILGVKDIPRLVHPLDVKEIYGIGKKTYPVLHEAGIHTVKDFINSDNENIVRDIVGSQYDYFINALSGRSNNVVDPERYKEPESISKSSTFDTPLQNYNEVLDELLKMSDDVHRELKRSKKKAKTITITLRDTDFKTITRSKSISLHTSDKTLLNYYMEELLEDNYDGRRLRLVGVGYSHFVDESHIDEEITLFNYEDVYKKEETLKNLMEDFAKRFGDKTMFFGKKLNEKE